MRRREFIAVAGAASIAWPRSARTQRERGIGVLYSAAESDAITQRSLSIFRTSLERHGWRDGDNIRIDYRFTSDAKQLKLLAEELVALNPEVIFASTTPSVVALKHATDRIPIVFVSVANPLASGIIKDLARPEANITGFANSAGATPLGKLLELLKEIAPAVSRAGVMFNPDSAAAGGAIAVNQFSEGCKVLNLEGTILAVRDKEAIDSAIAGLSGAPKAGLVLTQDIFVSIHRGSIIGSTARHRVPAVYPFSFFCLEGGLISYGVDVFVGHAEAANYVDRILRGEKPADLPVQQPTKLELVMNLKTAKALGITLPPTLLARADELIE